MTAWPPTLELLKVDLDIDPNDARKDAVLQLQLDSAVSFVERVRKGDFAFSPVDPDTFGKPEPDADTVLGTLRLAGRWHARRRTPDGMLNMGELGSTRVTTGDGDIDRMLRIGRHAKGRVG